MTAEALAITSEQQEQMDLHCKQDVQQDPLKLTGQQQEQLDRDLEKWLPNGVPTEVPVGVDAVAGRLAPIDPLPEISVERFAPVAPTLISPVRLDGRAFPEGWAYRAFPKGGTVYHDKPSWMQRSDQGQDYEIPWGCHIIAPGWGHCVSHLSDRPFPYGFGSPYMVVYIGDGRFGGRLWYLGHMNYVQIHVGESFHTGRALGRLYNSLNAGRGWIEFGHAAYGFPMAMGEGAKWKYLFESPEYRWSY